jgi:hypothetical protein
MGTGKPANLIKVSIVQAILTKWLPATNTKPSRIKAMCATATITMSADGGYQKDHREVAEALCNQLGWNDKYYGKLMGGELPDGTFAFVFNNPASEI